MSVSTMARHFRDTSRFPTLQLPTLRFALLVIVVPFQIYTARRLEAG